VVNLLYESQIEALNTLEEKYKALADKLEDYLENVVLKLPAKALGKRSRLTTEERTRRRLEGPASIWNRKKLAAQGKAFSGHLQVIKQISYPIKARTSFVRKQLLEGGFDTRYDKNGNLVYY